MHSVGGVSKAFGMYPETLVGVRLPVSGRWEELTDHALWQAASRAEMDARMDAAAPIIAVRARVRASERREKESERERESVCERGRESERERERKRERECVCVRKRVCVCERERER